MKDFITVWESTCINDLPFTDEVARAYRDEVTSTIERELEYAFALLGINPYVEGKDWTPHTFQQIVSGQTGGQIFMYKDKAILEVTKTSLDAGSLTYKTHFIRHYMKDAEGLK